MPAIGHRGDQENWEWRMDQGKFIISPNASLKGGSSTRQTSSTPCLHRDGMLQKEMSFNNIGVVFIFLRKTIFFSCAENKCGLVLLHDLSFLKVSCRVVLGVGPSKFPALRKTCSVSGTGRGLAVGVSDVRHAMAAWSSWAPAGGRHDLQQLDKRSGSASVCGHWLLPEHPGLVGDIKARHPGITPRGCSVWNLLPKMLTQEKTGLWRAPRPSKMVSHSSHTCHFWNSLCDGGGNSPHYYYIETVKLYVIFLCYLLSFSDENVFLTFSRFLLSYNIQTSRMKSNNTEPHLGWALKDCHVGPIFTPFFWFLLRFGYIRGGRIYKHTRNYFLTKGLLWDKKK